MPVEDLDELADGDFFCLLCFATFEFELARELDTSDSLDAAGCLRFAPALAAVCDFCEPDRR